MLRKLSTAVTLICVFSCFNALAAKIPVGTMLACSFDSVRLTSVTLSGDTNELLSQGYDASDCAGFYGNDDSSAYQPKVNIGEFSDGLLNGDNIFFNDGAFITSGDLLDLDGNGTFTDPGWIQLASSGATPLSIDYKSINLPSTLPFDIGSVLNITFKCSSGDSGDCTQGAWSLETSPSIVSEVQALLGRSTFDHLAISLKVGQRFVVYDFNFKDIFAQEILNGSSTSFDFVTAYNLSGTFNTSDMTNKHGIAQGISHVNVWARDPILSSDVSEPAALALFGMGLLLVALRRR